MELKQVVVNNSGMSQDFSISKQDDKFAFENRNIRVQSTNDGTLMSVTNLKDPLFKNTTFYCNRVLGSCVTPDYLVIFCKVASVRPHTAFYDTIYRIDLKDIGDDVSVKTLYDGRNGGNLNFNDSSYFDTLYFEENEYVKKVYWTDGKNSPRVINLITPGERVSEGATFTPYTKNEFEFYPKIGSIPSLSITKNRTVPSELHAGVIQYFVSYYTINGAETLVANSSDLYTIDFANRGAKADESGMCAFDITIPADSVNTEFDYMRIYSAIRTSVDGPLSVFIVGNIKIDKTGATTEYHILDNGIEKEQLQDGYIYFIGGTPFVAKTLTEKDDTVFFGNISTENVIIPERIKTVIKNNCFKDTQFSKVITFNLTKLIPNNGSVGAKYPYRLQLDKGSLSYKTFKSGETYRFGIQFQTAKGQWTDVVWIGDVKCTNRPSYDEETSSFKVNDAAFNLPENIINVIRDEGLDYINYRILYADPETSNGRKIQAQGILCPTMFTPGQRALNAPYSLPSWVMRPRKSTIAYHHFEPIFSSEVKGGEMASFTPGINYPKPFLTKNISEAKNCYIVTYFAISVENKMIIRSVKVWSNDIDTNFYDLNGDEPTEYEVLCDYAVSYGGVVESEYGNALRAIPKAGTTNNPYGFHGLSGNDKYEYTQVHYNRGGTATTDNVIGWQPVFEKEQIDIGLTPEPKTLEGIAHRLAASGTTDSWEFYRSVESSSDNIYYIGKHITDEFSKFNLTELNDLIKLKAFPLYGSTATTSSNISHNSSDVPTIHPGVNYNTSGGISNLENNIFSKKKTSYVIVNSPNIAYICTLPEIFRPRCTVNKNDMNPWGEDDDKYQFSESITSYNGIRGNWATYKEAFIQIIPLIEAEKTSKIKNSYNDYYVDESILTLNTPDIESVNKDIEDTTLSIIGVVPINNYTTVTDSSANFASPTGSINTLDVNTENKNIPDYSYYLYNDIGWKLVDNNPVLDIASMSYYNTYLFSANNFLGVTSESELPESIPFDTHPGLIKSQKILNQYFSNNTEYFDDYFDYLTDYNPYKYKAYCKKTDEVGSDVPVKTDVGIGLYRPFYENMAISPKTSHIFKPVGDDDLQNRTSNGTTRVKFSSTPHIVLNLQNREALDTKYILPHFTDDSTDYYRNIVDCKDTVWEGEVKSFGDKTLYNLPSNSRGEWSQYGGNNDIKSILSVWNAYKNESVSVKISGDYFIPVRVHINKGKLPPYYDLNELVKSALDDGLNVTFKVLKYGLNYRFSLDNSTATFEYVGTGSKFIIGVYETRTIERLIQHDERNILNVNKFYINRISYTLNSGTPISNIELIQIDNPAQDGENEVDTSILYIDHNYDDVEENLALFYFVWYNIYDLGEPSGDLPNYKEFIQYTTNDIDFPIKYESRELPESNTKPSVPYLFIGEVYNDISNEDLYGGTDETALRLLTWIPASKVTPLDSNVSTMEGDTYYQRWDCLKTYPTSVEDVNQVVDITSFMVETHKNLDARTDVNRAFYNIMSRPSNFNLFNEVYNQKNNTFTYTTNWNDLNSTSSPNLIAWSMTKNYLGDVDTWTNVNLSSATSVKYPVTKLVNYNNNVIAITEHSLEVVNFNAKQLVPATDNSFIELQNSTKVNGTTKLQAPYGSYNMNTLITEKGLYFVDDNENSIIRLGGDAGISKLGSTSMSDWLRNNIVKGTYTHSFKKPFRLEYDKIHKDIYIINEDSCLVYSELLDTFTSFIDYTGEYWLFNYNGKLYSFRVNPPTGGFNNYVGIFEMYAGTDYNSDFGTIDWDDTNQGYIITDNPTLTYSVWYRIGPNGYSDKVFTNGTLMADCTVGGQLASDSPFNTLRVWNEYQDTTQIPLIKILDRPSNLKQRFRFWRFNIPRDYNSKFRRDRIRNPWINLQLKGDSVKKMEFHNLTVQYME